MDDFTMNVHSNWWAFLLRGIAAIAFGISAFAWPALTLTVLIALIGAYILADGLIELGQAIRDRERDLSGGWWLREFEGVLGIAVGLLTFFAPGVTAFMLLMFIAAWAVVSGMFRIVLAIRMRREIEGDWFLVSSGVLSVLFGMLVFAVPGAGPLSVVWLIGIYAVTLGVLLIGLALRLRRENSENVRV